VYQYGLAVNDFFSALEYKKTALEEFILKKLSERYILLYKGKNTLIRRKKFETFFKLFLI
jgi:hypothetical protein